MIVLDTNVLSELMRTHPSPAVVAWVDRQEELTLYLTSLTLAEIRFGIAALPEGRRRAGLSDAFERRIRPSFGSRVLDFDDAASRSYAHLRAAARSRGLAIGTADAQIAAVVHAHGMTIATRDVSPFRAVGLEVIDPFEHPVPE